MATSIGMKLGIDGEAEYRKQLNNIITSTKTLDKQMEELQSSFTSETSAMEKNAKETELLQKKAEKLNDEVEMMQKMVDAAADKFGESSTQCQKWEASLAKAQTELNRTNAEIQQHQDDAENANSALGQLTSTIDEQTAELDNLKESYVNASLEFGENSSEAQELASQITDLSAELENNKSRLEEVTQSAEDLASGSDETKSALETLTEEIASQQTELDNLRDGYVNAVLEFGEGSSEAEALAGQISNLSTELENNQQKLDGAKQSLQNMQANTTEATSATSELATNEMSVGDAAAQMAGAIDSNFGSIVQTIANADVAGLMMTIADNVLSIVDNLWEMQLEFDSAQTNVAVMTGAVGEDLKKMQDIAVDAWAAVANEDATEEEYARIVGNLNTRLGATGEELKNLTEWFGIYSATLGVDGADAVNDLVDVMQKWNLTSEDNSTNLNTIIGLMDEMTAAQQLADVSVTELAQHLVDQSGTFQELGMGIEDSIGLMVAYRDAGGNVSEITRAMDATINHLSGETDDLDGCWNEIIKTLTTSDSKMDALSHTVGDTGKTIMDIFGQKLAGRVYDTFNSAGVDVENFTEKVKESTEGARGALSQTYQASRTDTDNFTQWFRETFQKDFLGSWTEGEETVNEAAANMTNSMGNACTDMTQATEDMKVSVTQDYSEIKNNLATNVNIKLNDNLDDLETNASNAFYNVGAGYNALRNTLSIPAKLQVTAPIITYSTAGSGNGTAYYKPYVSYETFAQGYTQAMILSAPTIFGASGNKLLVGGDRAGNEVVVGEQHLLEMFTKAVKQAGSSSINIIINGAEGQNVNELADAVIDKLQMQIIGSEAVYA